MPDLLELSHDRRLKNHFSIDQKRRTSRHRQSAPHFHSYYEVYYMMEGECRYFLLDSVYHLKSGHFLIVPPGAYHICTYDGITNSDRYAMYFDHVKIPQPFAGFSEFDPDPAKHLYHFQIQDDYKKELQSLFALLLSYFQAENEHSCQAVDHLFYVCLLHMILYSVPAPVENEDCYSTLEAAARYIAANYSSPITLEDAAKYAGFTPSYFSRKFKEMAGIGFHDYLTHIRLKNSADLLRSTALSIQEISSRCGFTSSNYFGDVFRSAYGVSPRSYRKKDDISIKQPT